MVDALMEEIAIWEKEEAAKGALEARPPHRFEPPRAAAEPAPPENGPYRA